MANAGSFSIVFLFENQANSLQVVQSLKEKGLDTHTVASAPELIQTIAGQKFDLVCLSVNHPSASSLVQVLKIKTQVAVLVFGEDAVPATTKAVFKTAADYHVAGVISSYNLWMKIGHLVKDKQRHSDSAAKSLSLKTRSEDEAPIMITSSERGKEQQQQAMGKAEVLKSNLKIKETTTKLMNSLSTEGAEPPKERKKEKKLLMGNAKKKAILVQKEESEDESEELPVTKVSVSASALQKMASVAQMVEEKKTPPSDRTNKEAPRGKLLMMGKSKVKENKGKILLSKEKKTAVPIEDQSIESEIDQIESLFFKDKSIDSKVHRPAQAPEKDPVGSVMLMSKDDHMPHKQLVVDDNDQSIGSVALVDETIKNTASQQNLSEESSYDTEADKIVSIEAARLKKKKLKAQKEAQKKLEQQKPAIVDSIHRLKFKKVFKEAVGKAGEIGYNKAENKKAIGVVTRISLIPVDNPNERGFILMANSFNNYTTEDEVSAFKNSLTAEMTGSSQDSFELGETFNIETFQVDLSEWAERSSQFSYTYESPDSGKQVLICFLKRENLFPHARKMDDYDMHRIDIYEVRPKTPLRFDAYLFLERNEKMLPYLRRGGSLTAKQIQRLYKRGFKFLYVKDDEVREYYSFYLSTYLNQDFRLERKLA